MYNCMHMVRSIHCCFENNIMLFLRDFFTFAFHCLSLYSSVLCSLGFWIHHPSRKWLKKPTKSSRCFDLPLIAWYFHTCVWSSTEAWTVESLLALAQRSLGDSLSLCNTKKMFRIFWNYPFFKCYMCVHACERACVCKARLNWNWSTVQLTENNKNLG